MQQTQRNGHTITTASSRSQNLRHRWMRWISSSFQTAQVRQCVELLRLKLGRRDLCEVSWPLRDGLGHNLVTDIYGSQTEDPNKLSGLIITQLHILMRAIICLMTSDVSLTFLLLLLHDHQRNRTWFHLSWGQTYKLCVGVCAVEQWWMICSQTASCCCCYFWVSGSSLAFPSPSCLITNLMWSD